MPGLTISESLDRHVQCNPDFCSLPDPNSLLEGIAKEGAGGRHPGDVNREAWHSLYATAAKEGATVGCGSFGTVNELKGFSCPRLVCKRSKNIKEKEFDYSGRSFPLAFLHDPKGWKFARGLCQGAVQEIAACVAAQGKPNVSQLRAHHCLVDPEKGPVCNLVFERMGCDAHDFLHSCKRDAWRVRQPDVERLLPQIVFGLLQLHRSGIVHQDLRPPNIFVSSGTDDPCDEATTCVVGDLGEAVCHMSPHHHYYYSNYARDYRYVARTVNIGAGVYRAPEHEEVVHGESGVPTDMWALGMTFLELLLNMIKDAPASRAMKRYLKTPEGKVVPFPFTSLFDYGSSRVQKSVVALLHSGEVWTQLLPDSLGVDGKRLIGQLLNADHTKRPQSMEAVWRSPYIERLRLRNNFRPEMEFSGKQSPTQALVKTLSTPGSPISNPPAWPVTICSNRERDAASKWCRRSFDVPHRIAERGAHAAIEATPAEVLLRMCTLGGSIGIAFSSILRAQRIFHTSRPHCESAGETLEDPELVALVLGSMSLASKVSGDEGSVYPCSLLETLISYRWSGVACPSLRQISEAECTAVNYAASCLFAPTLVSVIDLAGFDGRGEKGSVVLGMIGWHLENPGVDPTLANISGLDLLRFRRPVREWAENSGLVMKKVLTRWARSIERETPF